MRFRENLILPDLQEIKPKKKWFVRLVTIAAVFCFMLGLSDIAVFADDDMSVLPDTVVEEQQSTENANSYVINTTGESSDDSGTVTTSDAESLSVDGSDSGNDTALLTDTTSEAASATNAVVSDNISTANPSVKNPLAPKDGSAEIVEYVEDNGNNDVEKLIRNASVAEPSAAAKTTNDIPSVQEVIITNTNTKEVVDDYYQITETGQCVEIDANSYPLPKNYTTQTGAVTGEMQVKTLTYTSKNAIQKAIDTALAGIDVSGKKSSYEVTIAVDAGEYDGDITIEELASLTGVDWSKVTLYLLARDAFTKSADTSIRYYDKNTISADASGSVHINGKLTVSGIRTIIAGLFFGNDTEQDIKNTEVTIYGTSGADNVNAAVYGNAIISIMTGSGNDTINVSEYESGALPLKTPKTFAGSLDVNTGDGDDLVNLNVNAAYSVQDVTLKGHGRVNFTGSLKDNAEGSEVTDQTAGHETFKFTNTAGKTMAVKTEGFTQFTDTLSNKKEVTVTENAVNADGVIVISIPDGTTLTNYLIRAFDGKNNSGSYSCYFVTGADHRLRDLLVTGNGYFTGVVVDSTTDADISDKEILTIGNISSKADVRIIGTKITFAANTSVTANNLIVTATNADDLTDIKKALTENYFIFNIDAYINTEENSKISVGGAVAFTVEVTQTRNSLLNESASIVEDNATFLNVKCGDATISHKGTITAGGSVLMKTGNKVIAKSNQNFLADYYVFTAVDVVLIESTIDVDAGSEITANGSVELDAASDVDASSKAVLGVLPVSIGLTWLTNDTHVDVKGTVKAVNGSVNLRADSVNSVTAGSSSGLAEKLVIYTDSNGNQTGETSGTQTKNYGALAGLSIIKVTTYATISENASVTAGEDISLDSGSQVINSTYARTADFVTADGSYDKTETRRSALEIGKTILNKLAGVFGKSKEQKKLAAIQALLEDTAGYTISFEGTENGTMSAAYRAKAGEMVDLTLVPNDGYTVKSVQYKYYQSNALVIKDADKGTDKNGGIYYYIASMPSANITVDVIFEEQAEDDNTSIVNRTSAQQGASAADVLEAADEEYFSHPAYPTAETADKINISADKTYSMEDTHGDIWVNTKFALAGQKVKLTVSAQDGYKVSAVTVKYKVDGKEVEETVSESTKKGVYIYKLPQNIQADGGLVYCAQFTEQSEEEKGQTSSKWDDKYGCMALGIVTNTSKAAINIADNDTAVVSAGGILSLDSTAVTQSSVWADASAVKEQTTQTVVKNIQDESTKPETVTHAPARTIEHVQISEGEETYDLTLNIGATAAGKVEFNDVVSTEFRFNVTADEGYKVKAIQLMFVDKKDGSLVTFEPKLITKDNNSYLYGISAAEIGLSKYDGKVKVTTVFEGNPYAVTLDADQNLTEALKESIPQNVNAGAKISISVPNTGIAMDYAYTVKNKAGEVIAATIADGYLSFTMPANDVTITAVKKIIGIQVDAAKVSGGLTVQSYAAEGEKVSITPSEKLLQSGIKYTYIVTAKGDAGDQILVVTDGSFVVPAGTKTITISINNGGNKPYAIDCLTGINNGTVKSNTNYADKGETVTVTITPNTGYAIDTEKPLQFRYFTKDNTEKLVNLEETKKVGVYTFKVPDEIQGDNIRIIASFKESADTVKKTEKTAAGVGISLGIFTSKSEALIQSGNISAKSIEMTAENGTDGMPVKSEVLSNAGYAESDKGFAGAISVNVANITTSAMILKNAVITLNEGSLTIDSNCRSQIITKAEGGNTVTKAAKSGVGAAINAQVATIVTKSEIEDGTVIKNASAQKTDTVKVESVKISANTTDIETISTKAGSAGGSSTTPAIAAVISDITTDAVLGSGTGSIEAAKDVTISAKTAAMRTVKTNAGSEAANSAIGAAITFSLVDDSSESHVRRSIKAKNVSVEAVTRAMTLSTAQASAKGGRAKRSRSSVSDDGKDDDSDDADPGAQADGFMANILRLFGGSGKAGNQLKGRQRTQTTEENMTEAGALNINIQTTTALAEIESGLEITVSGNLNVISEARSDAYVTATSSATGSEEGVGVSGAVNVVTINNYALIGASRIEAGTLNVTAAIPKSAAQTGVRRQSTPAFDNILGRWVLNGVKYVAETVLSHVSLSDSVKKEITDNISTFFGNLITEVSQTLLNGTGLQGLIAGDVWTKVENLVNDFCKGNDSNYAKTLVTHAKNFVVNSVLHYIENKFESEEQKAVKPQYIEDSFTLPETLKRELTSLATDIFGSLVDANQFAAFLQTNYKDKLYNNLIDAFNKTKQMVGTFTINSILNTLGTTSEYELAGDRSTISTQAISGAGIITAGGTGSIAIAIVNNNVKAEIAGLSDAEKDNLTINVSNNIVIKADDKIRISTVASGAANQDGTADENDSASADTDAAGNGSGKYTEQTVPGTDLEIKISATEHGQISSAIKQGDGTYTITVKPDSGYRLKDDKIVIGESEYKNGSWDNATGSWTFKGIKISSASSISAEFEEELIQLELIFAAKKDGDAAHGTYALTDAKGNAIQSVGKADSGADIYQVRSGQKILIVLNMEDGYTVDTTTSYYNDYNGSAFSDQHYLNTFNKIGGNSLVLDLAANGNILKPGTGPVMLAAVYTLKVDDTHKALNKDETITPSGARIGVGASFAFTKEDGAVTAVIGENRKIIAGGIEIRANSNHIEDTKAVAGLDPLTSKAAKTKDSANFALDASVALSLINSDVKAATGAGCDITVTKDNSIILKTREEKVDGKTVQTVTADAASFYLSAEESGTAKTIASSFAVGNNDAVGASVALTLDDSDVDAIFEGTLTCLKEKEEDTDYVSDARILSISTKNDIARALATANGFDMNRLFSKFGVASDKIQGYMNDFASGNYLNFDKIPKNKEAANATTRRINNTINSNKAASKGLIINGLPISTNIQKAFNVASESVPDAVNENIKDANEEAGAANEVNVEKAKHNQYAAVVAVNVLNHDVHVKILGSITAGIVTTGTNLSSNFYSMATATAMTRAAGANSAAGAVAVVVDNNTAYTYVAGNITARKSLAASDDSGLTKNIYIYADLTENMSKGFISSMTAQSISGAVTGENAGTTLSATISIVRSKSSSVVEIANGSRLIADRNVGDVVIASDNKSKLAVRAGAISVSSGTAYGTGASFALIYDDSIVNVILGTKENADNSSAGYLADKIRIEGNDLNISAVKEDVNFSDTDLSLNWSYLVTKSKQDQPSSSVGLIDFQEKVPSKTYEVTVNFNTDKLLDALNIVNMLLCNNYYVEAISGEIASTPVQSESTSGTVNAAGSMALLFYRSDIGVTLGRGIQINLTGDANITAEDRTTKKIIAGGMNVSPAKVGVGATVGAFDNKSNTYTNLGSKASVTTGSYTQKASEEGNNLVVTIAAAISTGTSAKASVGGVVNVINLKNTVNSTVGSETDITAANKNIVISADTDNTSASAAAAWTGLNGSTAVGGTVGVVVSDTTTAALVGDGVKMKAPNGDIDITASAKDKLVNVLAAAAPAIHSDNAVAGTIGVTIGGGTIQAIAGNNVEFNTVTSPGKNINITAESENWILSIDMAVSTAQNNAVGAAVIINKFTKTVDAKVGTDTKLYAGGDVTISASASDWELITAVTTGAAQGVSISGVIPVCISKNIIQAIVSDRTQITAGGSIGLLSGNDTKMYTAAGGLAVSLSDGKKTASGTGVGATISTMVNNNTAASTIGDGAVLTAMTSGTTNGVKLPNRKTRRKGIVIYSGGQSDIVSAAIGVAAGSAKAEASGIVNTVYLNNQFASNVHEGATLICREAETQSAASGASGTEEDSADEDDPDAAAPYGIHVITEHDLDAVINTDGAAISGATGISGTGVVSTFVSNVTLEAALKGTANASDDIEVKAYSAGEAVGVAICAEGGKVGIGGAVQTLSYTNKVNAYSKAQVISARDIKVTAYDKITQYNILIGGGGSVSGGGTGVAAITIFEGTTQAYIADGSVITKARNINVHADSKQYINADSTGAGGSKGIEAAGAVNVISDHVTTKAWIGKQVKIGAKDQTRVGNIDVRAKNAIELVGVTVYVSGGGDGGVGVAVSVLVDTNTVYAAIEDNCNITASDVNVIANADRKVIDVTSTVSGSGKVGVGAAVSVVVSGSKMPENAAKVIASGSIKADAVLAKCLSDKHLNGYAVESDMNILLAGDGQSAVYSTDLSKFGTDQTGKLPGSYSADELKEIGSSTEVNADDPINDSSLPAADNYDVDYTINASAFTADSSNSFNSAITAMIGSGTVIDANNITVSAEESVNYKVITGQVEGAKTVGAGVGASVVVMNTAVNALVSRGAQLTASGDIIVHAASGASENADANTVKEALKISGNAGTITNSYVDPGATLDAVEASGNISEGSGSSQIGKVSFNNTENKILLVGFEATGGKFSAGLNGSIFVAHDHVSALSAADMTAKNITVSTSVDYGEILAVSAGANAGKFAGGVNVAIVYNDAAVETGIAGDVAVKAPAGNVKVISNGIVKAQAAAANLAGGVAGVVAGSSVVINKMNVITYIGQGADVQADIVYVGNTYVKDSRAYGITAAFGQAAVGVSVSVVKDELNAIAVIGKDNNYTYDTGSNTVKGVKANKVNVTSDLTGSIYILGVPVAGGEFGFNGLVTVGINKSTGIAEVIGKPMETGSLNILATLNGDIYISDIGISVYYGGGGTMVAVGKQVSVNRAVLDLNGQKVQAGSLCVNAGESRENPSYSDVTVKMYGAGALIFGGDVYLAFSFNNAKNESLVKDSAGKGALTVNGDAAVCAYGKSYAYTFTISASVGAITVNPTMAYAKINSYQTAAVDLASTVKVAGNLLVRSIHNEEASGNEWNITAYSKTEGSYPYVKKGTKTNVCEACANVATVTGASAVGTLALSKADAVSSAYIKASGLYVSGNLDVHNKACSSSSATTWSISVGVISAGTVISHAYAEGTFNAFIESDGAIEVYGAGGIHVVNDYISNCISDLTPAGATVKIEVGEIKVNFAFARSTTVANVYIQANKAAHISSGKDIDLRNYAITKAFSIIRSAVVSLHGGELISNVSKARVIGTHNTYVSGGDVIARSLLVNAYINVENVPEYRTNADTADVIYTRATDTGAYTSTGMPLISISVANISPDYANAIYDIKGDTYAAANKITLTGDLTIHTSAVNKAEAKQNMPVTSDSGVSVPIAINCAEAHGTFRTWLDVKDAVTVDGDVSIITDGETSSNAVVAPVGNAGTGVDITLLEIKINKAQSLADTNYTTYLEGSGVLTANNLTIKTNGTAAANTETAKNLNVTFSAVNVRDIEAEADMRVKAEAGLDYNGTVNLKGTLSVSSKAAIKTIASAGNTNGAKITFASGQKVVGSADSASSVIAVLKGSGEFNIGGNFNVDAGNDSTVKTTVSNPSRVDITLGIQCYEGSAVSQDSAVVQIIGGTEALNLHIKGDVNIHSWNNADVDVITIAANSASFFFDSNESVSNLWAGKNKEHPELSEIMIDGRVNLTADGTIGITAYNSSSSVIELDKYTAQVGALSNSSNDSITHTYLKTVITIGDQAVIVSAKSGIDIHASDLVKEYTEVDKDSVGIVLSADHKRDINQANQDVQINIKNARIEAFGDVSIRAESNAYMTARTEIDGGGIISGGDVTANNDLVRSVTINILDSAQIISDYGDIMIRTNAGEQDSIKGTAEIKQGGLVVHESNAIANLDYTSESVVNIGKGVHVKCSFGDIDIRALISMGYVSLYAHNDVDGGVAIGESQATINWGKDSDHMLRANVVITGDHSAPVEITAANINIFAKISKIEVNLETYCSSCGLGGRAKCYSRLGFGLDVKVDVSNAKLTAYNTLQLWANGKVDSGWVKLHSKTYGGGIATVTRSYCYFQKMNQKVGVSICTNIGSGVTLAGNTINVFSGKFEVNHSEQADASRASLLKPSRETKFDFADSKAETNIADGTVFILNSGSAYTGIVFKYDGKTVIEENNGLTVVDSVIDPINKKITLRSVYGTVNSSTLKVQNNKNVNGLAKCKILLNSDIWNYDIYNLTDYSLEIESIGRTSEASVDPEIIFENCVSNAKPQPEQYTKSAEDLHIVSAQAADLLLTGNIMWESGNVVIEWTGEKGGSLFTAKGLSYASVWANTLTITGAENIGTVDNKAWFYLAQGRDKKDPEIMVKAAGSVYIRTSLAEINRYMDGTLPECSADPISGTIKIKELSAGSDKVCDFTIDRSIRINYFGYMKKLSLYLLSSHTYTTDYVLGTEIISRTFDDPEFLFSHTDQSVSMSLANADLYVMDEYSTENAKAVLLTNGMIMYLSKTDNKVLSIVTENGYVLDVSEILLADENTIYLKSSGIYFNFKEGYYYLADDTSIFYQRITYDANGQPLELDGKIVSEDKLIIYDQKYNTITADISSYTTDGYDGYFNWFTKTRIGETGYVIAYDKDGNFAGAFRALKNDGNTLTLKECLSLVRETVTGTDLWKRLYYGGVDMTGYEELITISDKMVLYTYSNSMDTPEFFVMQFKEYYYIDSRSQSDEQKYKILFDSSFTKKITRVNVGSFSSRVVRFSLPIQTGGTGTALIKIIQDKDWAADGKKTIISFKSADKKFVILDNLTVTRNGTVIFNNLEKNAGSYAEYNVLTGMIRLAETWVADNANLAYRAVIVDTQKQQVTLFGKRHLWLLDENTGFDVNGDFYSYIKQSAEKLKCSRETVKTDKGDLQVTLWYSAKDVDRAFMAVGTDHDGNIFGAEIQYDAQENPVEAAVIDLQGKIKWYRFVKGVWTSEESSSMIRYREVDRINTTDTIHVGSAGIVTLTGTDSNIAMNVELSEGVGTFNITNGGDVLLKSTTVGSVQFGSVISKNGNVTINLGRNNGSSITFVKPTDEFKNSISGKKINLIADTIGSEEQPLCLDTAASESISYDTNNLYIMVNGSLGTADKAAQFKCKELHVESWTPDLDVHIRMIDGDKVSESGSAVYLKSQNPVSGTVTQTAIKGKSEIKNVLESTGGFKPGFNYLLDVGEKDTSSGEHHEKRTVQIIAGAGDLDVNVGIVNKEYDLPALNVNLITGDKNITVNEHLKTDKIADLHYNVTLGQQGTLTINTDDKNGTRDVQMNGIDDSNLTLITNSKDLSVGSKANHYYVIYKNTESDNVKLTADDRLIGITKTGGGIDVRKEKKEIDLNLTDVNHVWIATHTGVSWVQVETDSPANYPLSLQGTAASKIMTMTINGSIVYKGKVVFLSSGYSDFIINAPHSYVGTDNNHTGFSLETVLRVTYNCLRYSTNGSDDDAEENDSDGAYDKENDSFNGLPAMTMSFYAYDEELEDEYLPNILAYTYLTQGSVSYEDIQAVMEAEDARADGKSTKDAMAFEEELELYGTQIRDEIQDMLEKYHADILTVKELKNLLRNMSKEDVEYYTNLLLRAVCLEILLGNLDEAEYYLELAEVLAPEEYEYLINIFKGDILLQKGQSGEAEKYLNVYLEAEKGLDREVKYPLIVSICRMNEADQLADKYAEMMVEKGYTYDEAFIEKLSQGIMKWQEEVAARYEK